MARKDATYKDLVKIFKSWQVCDWLAKWIIMLRFMDIRWPRIFGVPMSVLFIYCFIINSPVNYVTVNLLQRHI